MATLKHRVWINASAAKVFSGVATAEGLGSWWAPHTSTRTDAGLVLAHAPGVEHGEVRLLVIDSVPDRRVEFEMSERESPRHWLGLSDDGARLTVLELSHSGWDEASEYFGFCNFAWGETLVMLKPWCEA